jgi:hypothetical protein
LFTGLYADLDQGVAIVGAELFLLGQFMAHHFTWQAGIERFATALVLMACMGCDGCAELIFMRCGGIGVGD